MRARPPSSALCAAQLAATVPAKVEIQIASSYAADPSRSPRHWGLRGSSPEPAPEYGPRCRGADCSFFRWNQRDAVLDDDGKLLGFEKLPFENQLKKIIRRAPGSELRFSDVGGICSPEERRQQTASRHGRYRILPRCGWVHFKGRRKNGARDIEPVMPDDDAMKAFWSRYPNGCAPRVLYWTMDGSALMPGSFPESWKMV